jgi:hypothetical protein
MPNSNVKESIDERILRLLGLEDVFDLDYDTYLTLLKEAMVKGRMPKTMIPTEEIEALTGEYKRVKGKKNKGRFEVKKGKKINATSFNFGKTKGLIARNSSVKALPAAIGTSPVSKSLDDNISAITAAVISIHETLKQQQNLLAGSLETDRRRREKEKGDAAENKLEKRFEGLKKIAEKIISPVKSILDKIIDFLVNVLLGRVVIKLLDWLADPKNATKVKSIIRFLGDWGPALIGGFILFGTKFGKGIRVLTRIALSGIAKLAKAIPSLIRFARGNPRTALALAAGTYATTQLAERAFSGGENAVPKVEGRVGGGVIRIPKFAGGGFNNFFNGFVSGEKGVDKVPAMLSDGEFVMSRGAVAMYGVDTLEGMNAAGGGTNKPKLIGGVPHAAGGGLIGSVYEAPKSRNLKPVVDEIIRGLAPRYKWAKDLATRTGVVISKSAGNLLEGGQRVAGEGMKMINPTIQRAQRVAGEGMKMINPTIQRAQRVAGEVKKKVDPAIQSALKFRPDLSGIQTVLGNASGAAQEALPALYNSMLGVSRTDKSISEDMQKSLLQARNTAGKRGRNYVDYKDYVGGGLSAGGLTMGRIADKEWKRDAKGRIIGLRQVYDTNRSAGEALNEAGSSWGKFFKSGLKDTGALGRGIYKPAEALLAAVQNRGTTMHDVNFSEKVLGFKPGKEVLSPTQKKMIKEQKNKEALQAKRPWWDQAGMFGGASRDIQEKAKIAKSKPVAKPVKPPAKPQAKVVYGPPVPSRSKSKKGGAPKSSVPNFTAGSPGMRSKTQTLGMMR